MSARRVFSVFCVCLAGCLAQSLPNTAEKDTEWDGAVDSTDGAGMDVSRDCEGHCSLTYPQHTYPNVRTQFTLHPSSKIIFSDLGEIGHNFQCMRYRVTKVWSLLYLEHRLGFPLLEVSISHQSLLFEFLSEVPLFG